MKKIIALAAAAFGLISAGAEAVPMSTNSANRDYLVPYVGIFDVLDSKNRWQFGAEYRFRDIFYGVRPTLGANVTDRGDIYGYGGINWEVPLIANTLFLTPNFMVGAYGRGDGKDLGGPLEFRSGIELAWQFNNMSRVGVAFNHISNASIYSRNPGAETLLINYAIPLNSVF